VAFADERAVRAKLTSPEAADEEVDEADEAAAAGAADVLGA